MPFSGPAVARRQLGRRLQALRESAGITTQQVDDAQLASKPKLWRIETGKQRVTVPDILALCDLYGASPAETSALKALAAQTSERGLGQQYRDAVPEWFKLYVGLEAVAATITTFDDSVVPGELQTADYTRALWRGARPDLTDEQIVPHVCFRAERQRVLLERCPAPRLTVVVGENVLRRAVGGPEVLRAQIEHLRKLADRPGTEIRYLPFSAGAHPAVTGPFRILQFDDVTEPDMVYAELAVGAYYLEKPAELQAYRQISELLISRSVPLAEF